MTVDPTRCPDCAAKLTGGPTCDSCGLLLRGPLALQLWQVSNDLHRLVEVRAQLLEALRPPSAGGTARPVPVPADTSPAQAAAAPAAAAPPAAAPAAAAPAAPAAAPATRAPGAAVAPAAAAGWSSGGAADAGWQPPTRSAPADPYGTPRRPPPRPRKEWTPQRVQNTLLATGALLLIVAAIAFTAFAWGRLPIAARGAIMLAVTGITGWTACWVHRRGLDASAEAIGLLTVLFGAVDAYAARRSNLAGLAATDAATYWSVASGVLAGLSAAFARVLPVRSVRYAALAGAQLPLVITAFRIEVPTLAQRGALLTLQAAALALAAHRLSGTATAARVSAAANWAVGAYLAASTALLTSTEHHVRIAALVLLATGGVALLAPGDRTVPAGVATFFAICAIVAPTRLTLEPVQIPAAVAAAGLLALVAAAAVQRPWRAGPVVVATGTVGVAVLSVSVWVGQLLVLPFSWAARPWALTADLPVRDALAEDGTRWGGTVVTLVVVAVAIVAVAVVAEVFDRWAAAAWWLAGLGAAAVLTLPLGLAVSYRATLACYVVLAAAALAVSAVRRYAPLAAPATVVLGVATGWSLADERMTLAVVAAVTLAYLAYAVAYDAVREYAAGVAAAGACGFAVALAASRGAPADRVGFVLALTAFALMAVAAVLGGRVVSVEGVAGAAYVLALGLTLVDPGWLAWTLAGGAVTAAASTPRRRPLAGVAAALAAAASAALAVAAGFTAAEAGLAVGLTACVLVGVGAVLRYGDVSVVGAVAYALGAFAAAGDLTALSYVLGAGAVTAGVAAYRDRDLAAVSAGLAIACVGTSAAALGAPLDRAGFFVALASVAALGAGYLLRGNGGDEVDGVAVAGYGVAALLTVTDPGWLSWVLLAGGIAALVEGLRPERRYGNWAATVLLTLWTWDRLLIEQVRMPEAYAAPVAVLLLALGHLRRRREPDVSSWIAYGRGLGVAFAPTTYLVLSDPGVTRPVLLALAGAAVLLAGVQQRLQAPLTIGATALAIDALVQLAPVAVALPKWATIGAVGLLVIAVGVTYEDRRRDVAKLREEFDALT